LQVYSELNQNLKFPLHVEFPAAKQGDLGLEHIKLASEYSLRSYSLSELAKRDSFEDALRLLAGISRASWEPGISYLLKFYQSKLVQRYIYQ
jgi:hypothetical protein